MRRALAALAALAAALLLPRAAAAACAAEPTVAGGIALAGGCLYLLFRRGSIAYRAQQDMREEKL